jgi:fucose permease
LLQLGFAAFGAFGFILVLVAANQHELAQVLSLDLQRTGLLGSTLIAGIGIGVAAAGPLYDRGPRRPIFIGACVLVAAGASTVSASMGFTRACAHVIVIGLGAGLYETVLNASVIQQRGTSAGRSIAVLHSAATLGAMAAPLVFGGLMALGQSGFEMAFRMVAALHLGLAAWALVVEFPAHQPSPDDREPTSEPATARGSVLLGPAMLALYVCGFAYVGVESSLTLFAIPWSTDVLALDVGRGRAGISAFWFGLLVGRLGSAALPGPLTARWLAGSGLAGGVVVAVAWIFAPAAPELLLGAAGLAMGGVFPLMVALAGRAAPEAAGRAVGWVAGIASAGGFALPWLTGAFADGIGLRASLGTLVVWCIVLAIAATIAGRHMRRSEEV